MSDLRDYYASAPLAKTYRAQKPPRRIRPRRKPKAERDRIAEVRQYVFARERHVCRCCRFRMAESMHELRPKSLRGRVSKRNSIAVCGDGVRGCHGHLQRHEITFDVRTEGAEGGIYFMPRTEQARAWMKLGERHGVESLPMRSYEED